MKSCKECICPLYTLDHCTHGYLQKNIWDIHRCVKRYIIKMFNTYWKCARKQWSDVILSSTTAANALCATLLETSFKRTCGFLFSPCVFCIFLCNHEARKMTLRDNRLLRHLRSAYQTFVLVILKDHWETFRNPSWLWGTWVDGWWWDTLKFPEGAVLS